MKMRSFLKCTFGSLSLLVCFALCGCSGDSLDESLSVPENSSADNLMSRAGSWHWICKCGFLNVGWRNSCSSCGKEYSSTYSDGFTLSLIDQVVNKIEMLPASGEPEIGQVECPGGVFLYPAPEPWYEETQAINIYNMEKHSSIYGGSATYVEGFDFGWYHTVCVLYPQFHQAARVTMIFERFKSSVTGQDLLRTTNGKGLIDGTEAAIKAFGEVVRY